MSEIQNSTVSVVVPTLGHVERLRVSLPALVRSIEARGFEPDEILIVDDSGDERGGAAVAEVLGALDATRKGSVQVITTEGREGFARAVARGAERARGSLLLVCQDDVVLEDGALHALTRAMRDDQVFAAGPMVRQSGDPGPVTADGEHRDRLVPHVRLIDDRVEVREAQVGGAPPAAERATFLPSCCLMVRRAPFQELGGFDDVFSPLGWEDVDLGIAARRKGMRVVRVGDANAVHHGDLPNVWDGIDEDLAMATLERNRLLARWKHLATRGEATEHLVSLWRQVLEAGLAGDRSALERVCLAFEKLPQITESRAKLAGNSLEMADVI